jgi:hypothetical protein
MFDRIRSWFRSEPDPDHPLSEEEREGVPQTTQDEASSLIDGLVDPNAEE